MDKLSVTMDEVGYLIMIAARFADELVTANNVDDRIKSAALKCKASSQTIVQDGVTIIQIAPYEVLPKRYRF